VSEITNLLHTQNYWRDESSNVSRKQTLTMPTWRSAAKYPTVTWAAPAGWQGGSCPPVPYALAPRLPPVVVRKNYMCPLHPSHPLSQR